MSTGWALCEIMAGHIYMVTVIAENHVWEHDVGSREPGQLNRHRIGSIHTSFVLGALYNACLGFVRMSNIVFGKL